MQPACLLLPASCVLVLRRCNFENNQPPRNSIILAISLSVTMGVSPDASTTDSPIQPTHRSLPIAPLLAEQSRGISLSVAPQRTYSRSSASFISVAQSNSVVATTKDAGKTSSLSACCCVPPTLSAIAASEEKVNITFDLSPSDSRPGTSTMPRDKQTPSSSDPGPLQLLRAVWTSRVPIATSLDEYPTIFPCPELPNDTFRFSADQLAPLLSGPFEAFPGCAPPSGRHRIISITRAASVDSTPSARLK